MSGKAIEAAARAIARSKCCPLTHSEIQIGLFVDKRWEEYSKDARTAVQAYLAAMEAEGWPTPEDVLAALVAIDREGEELYHIEDLQAFARAMIAARPQPKD